MSSSCGRSFKALDKVMRLAALAVAIAPQQLYGGRDSLFVDAYRRVEEII